VAENAITRRTVRLSAESHGFEVYEAPNVDKAVERALNGGLDLVLHEVAAGEPAALNALTRLRSALGGMTPVVAISAPLSKPEEAQLRATGASEVLLKPLEPSRLADLFRRRGGGRTSVSTRFRRARYALVCEASREEATRLRAALEKAGLEVSVVADGPAAIDSARKDPPDVVVASFALPKIDGMGLCAELKRDQRFVAVPVFITTSLRFEDEDVRRARGVGAAAIVTVKGDASELASIVAEAVRAAPQSPRGAQPAIGELPEDQSRIVRQKLEESARIAANLTRRVALHEAGLSILAGLSESLEETTSVEAVLDRLLRQGLDAAGITKGAAYLREPDGALALRSQVGFGSAGVGRILSFFGREDLLRHALDQGMVIRVPADAPTAEEKHWLEQVGARFVAIAPFGRADRISGVLVMASRSIEFGEDWLAFARGCAGLIGQALELTRALARRETVARQQAAIADLGRRAIARTSLQEVIDDAAETTLRTLEADLAGVFAPDAQDPGSLALRSAGGFGASAPGSVREPQGPGSLSGLALAAHEAIVSPDLSRESRFTPLPPAVARGVMSAAAVPIPGGKKAFGALAAYARKRAAFASEEVSFLSGVASVIASAVERDEAQAALLESDERFRQSQKMDAIGRLAGGIAHDFNNLLTGITGYCDLLLLSVRPDDPARADVEEIRKAAQRASGLTRQLLAFSRKQPAAPKILDLNQVLSSFEKMLRRLIGEDLELEVRLWDALGTISADQSNIEQVIVNLCVNARDAMPGGGRLTIETANVELDAEQARRLVGVAEGDYVLLRVTDTGCGMTKETLSRLFEPFFTTKELGKGTGLGLSTVYGIVKQCGGSIDVKSEPGSGSTFEVYLPRVDMPATIEVDAGAKSALPEGTETILLAEDDDLVRALTLRILRRAGYEVLEASRGLEALTLGEREVGRIQLLVTDVIMPELNGRDLARKLCERKPALKVLYTSGYTEQHISGHLDDRPETSFLSKPYSAKALLSAVRAALEGTSGA